MSWASSAWRSTHSEPCFKLYELSLSLDLNSFPKWAWAELSEARLTEIAKSLVKYCENNSVETWQIVLIGH